MQILIAQLYQRKMNLFCRCTYVICNQNVERGIVGLLAEQASGGLAISVGRFIEYRSLMGCLAPRGEVEILQALLCCFHSSRFTESFDSNQIPYYKNVKIAPNKRRDGITC